MNVRSVMMMAALACLTVLAANPAHANEMDTALAQRIAQLESRMQSLQSENQQMKQQVVRMEAERGESWLNERRAEEVKNLVHEVLADADTRATLLDDGMTAGHNGKNFYLASADGSFLMTIGGQLQVRYIYNGIDTDSGSATDENESGFTLRRTKLAFAGHVANPKLGYEIVLAAGNTDGVVDLEDFVISYKFDNGIKLKAGQFKLPFMREELVSSKRQLAMDRNPMTEGFTLDRGQGVQLEWGNDMFKVAAMVSDGADTEGTDYPADNNEVLAFTGRIDVLLCGEWGQMKDFSAWSGEPMGLFLGAAVHHETGEYGDDLDANSIDRTGWTVDGLFEMEGFSLMAAYAGLKVDEQDSAMKDRTHHGYLVQAGYFIIPDKLQAFVNYNYIDLDVDTGNDEFSTIGAGINWYHNKHNAKFTLDFLYGIDPLGDFADNFNNPATNGIGLTDDEGNNDGQVALRAGYQLLF